MLAGALLLAAASERDTAGSLHDRATGEPIAALVPDRRGRLALVVRLATHEGSTPWTT